MNAPKVRSFGFSLIEVSVALAVMAILLLGAVPIYRAEAIRTQEKQLRQSLMQIRQALDDYKRASDDGRIAKVVGSSGYPKNLEVLVKGAQKVGTQRPEWIYFLRRMPKDPFAAMENQESLSVSTWDTRAYSSAPDAPAPGADVFDVFSKSKRVGLNGIPYNKW